MSIGQGGARPPSGVVTPEAVLLEFETAGVSSRTIAELIDVVLQLAVLLALLLAGSFLVQAVGSGGGTIAAILMLVLAFLVILGYPIAMESLWNGRTLGKAALGLRVVTVEGGPVRFRHAAIRGIFGLFELWATFGSVAVLSVLFTEKNQRLGDLSAGTLVLRERTAKTNAAEPMTFLPPAGYEGYVASIDVSLLTNDQYGVIRSFLIRVLDLSPGARTALAVNLANSTSARLRHTPPAGIHPELFLLCVAAAYQQRHGGPVPPAPVPTPPAGASPFTPPPPSLGAPGPLGPPGPPAWSGPPPPPAPGSPGPPPPVGPPVIAAPGPPPGPSTTPAVAPPAGPPFSRPPTPPERAPESPPASPDEPPSAPPPSGPPGWSHDPGR